MNVARLLPADQSYYTFAGSLTTPPCSEGVTWYVLKSPVQVSTSQIAAFGKFFPMNARPIQPTNSRQILEGGFKKQRFRFKQYARRGRAKPSIAKGEFELNACHFDDVASKSPGTSAFRLVLGNYTHSAVSALDPVPSKSLLSALAFVHDDGLQLIHDPRPHREPASQRGSGAGSCWL